jgi:hypothetical protein
MDATRRQPLTQLDLKSVIRTYAESPADDGGVVARPDLVVAEVRRTETGWEVYGRPTSRPDSGPRVRALVTDSVVEVVAQEDELTLIRQALASYLRRRPEPPAPADAPREAEEVEVVNQSDDALVLHVRVRGAGILWRVTL